MMEVAHQATPVKSSKLLPPTKVVNPPISFVPRSSHWPGPLGQASLWARVWPEQWPWALQWLLVVLLLCGWDGAGGHCHMEAVNFWQ